MFRKGFGKGQGVPGARGILGRRPSQGGSGPPRLGGVVLGRQQAVVAQPGEIRGQRVAVPAPAGGSRPAAEERQWASQCIPP